MIAALGARSVANTGSGKTSNVRVAMAPLTG